jgi:hypothetical protein
MAHGVDRRLLDHCPVRNRARSVLEGRSAPPLKYIFQGDKRTLSAVIRYVNAT